MKLPSRNSVQAIFSCACRKCLNFQEKLLFSSVLFQVKKENPFLRNFESLRKVGIFAHVQRCMCKRNMPRQPWHNLFENWLYKRERYSRARRAIRYPTPFRLRLLLNRFVNYTLERAHYFNARHKSQGLFIKALGRFPII